MTAVHTQTQRGAPEPNIPWDLLTSGGGNKDGVLTRRGGGRGEAAERRRAAAPVEAREASPVAEAGERRGSRGAAQREPFEAFEGGAAVGLQRDAFMSTQNVGRDTTGSHGPGFTSPTARRLAFLIGRLFNTSSLATRNEPAFRRESTR